jgi:hypothetical protein
MRCDVIDLFQTVKQTLSNRKGEAVVAVVAARARWRAPAKELIHVASTGFVIVMIRNNCRGFFTSINNPFYPKESIFHGDSSPRYKPIECPYQN